ncbi:hypothetical protein ACHAQH_001989 [Verticillium albo-atrum]
MSANPHFVQEIIQMVDLGDSTSRRLPKPAERRQQGGSEATASNRAASLGVAMMRNMALEDQLNQDFAKETPNTCLRRMLSVKSVISTSSSLARRHQSAVGTIADFRGIGTGSIGKIYEHPGTVFAYKVPLTDNADKMWNNFVMHRRIWASFQADNVTWVQDQVEIPRCFWYAEAGTRAFWDEHIERFPHAPEIPRKPREIMCMEPIFPLPQPARHALIEKFCVERQQSKLKNSRPDKDCLVRPLLGRLKYGSGSLFFSLRNFQLHANQVEALEMEVADIVKSMARAVALCHWHARVDVMDAEFVLVVFGKARRIACMS